MLLSVLMEEKMQNLFIPELGQIVEMNQID